MDDTHRVWKGDSETSIDQTNQWMRAQPWYQQQMQQWGQDPGHPTLTKDQSKQIVRLAQANGAVVDEGNIEVDNHGNFNPIGHKLRNGLIGAGIAAGAAFGAPALAGLFGAGGAGAGAGAASAATGAGAAGGGAAAVGGGMTLGSISQLLGAGGAIASGIAGGRAAGRAQEAQMGNQADQLRLQAARLNLDAPQQRGRNSVQGDILAGVQPLTINGPITHTGGKLPQISGGLSPSLLSDNTRQLGQNMSRQALLSQMQGDFQPTPQPHANALDSILNGIGYAGLGANVLNQIPRRPPMPTIQAPPIASSNVQWPTFGGQ